MSFHIAQFPDDVLARQLSELSPQRLKSIGEQMEKSKLAAMGTGGAKSGLRDLGDYVLKEGESLLDHLGSEWEAEKRAQDFQRNKRRGG